MVDVYLWLCVRASNEAWCGVGGGWHRGCLVACLSWVPGPRGQQGGSTAGVTHGQEVVSLAGAGGEGGGGGGGHRGQPLCQTRRVSEVRRPVHPQASLVPSSSPGRGGRMAEQEGVVGWVGVRSGHSQEGGRRKKKAFTFVHNSLQLIWANLDRCRWTHRRSCGARPGT